MHRVYGIKKSFKQGDEMACLLSESRGNLVKDVWHKILQNSAAPTVHRCHQHCLSNSPNFKSFEAFSKAPGIMNLKLTDPKRNTWTHDNWYQQKFIEHTRLRLPRLPELILRTYEIKRLINTVNWSDYWSESGELQSESINKTYFV